MIGFKTDVLRPQVNALAIPRNAAKAADEIAQTVKNQVKLAIVRRSKIATGKTLKSIETERILDSPSRGMFRRHVVGARSWLNIQNGRRAGAKMPVRRISGAMKKGGGLFVPLPEMLEWFLALNIPRARWFPILRAIKKRGIKPVDIRDRAVRESRQMIGGIAGKTARAIAKELFGKP